MRWFRAKAPPPGAPSLAVLMLIRDDADALESALAGVAAALAPGDEVALADLGSGDDSAALADHFVARGGFGPGIRASVTALAHPPPEAARALALAATTARHVILLGGSDMLLPAGVARLRETLAADPPAVLAAERHWWIEPGFLLPPTPLPGPGSLVLRRDLALDKTLTWPSDPDPGAILALRARHLAQGAADLGMPLLASPLPRPVALPRARNAAHAAALIAAARRSPLIEDRAQEDLREMIAALPEAEWQALRMDRAEGRLAEALARGGADARAAWTGARLAAARRLVAALIHRLSQLAAERDALIPDAGELLRSHARLVAEIAAGRDRQ